MRLRRSRNISVSRITRFKVYYDRAGQYMNYVKNLIVVAAVYKIFENTKMAEWIANNLAWFVPVLLVSYVFSRVVIGWVDKRMKIREYEIEEYNKTDPNLRMIQKYLRDIKSILDGNSADGDDTPKN